MADAPMRTTALLLPEWQYRLLHDLAFVRTRAKGKGRASASDVIRSIIDAHADDLRTELANSGMPTPEKVPA